MFYFKKYEPNFSFAMCVVEHRTGFQHWKKSINRVKSQNLLRLCLQCEEKVRRQSFQEANKALQSIRNHFVETGNCTFSNSLLCIVCSSEELWNWNTIKINKYKSVMNGAKTTRKCSFGRKKNLEKMINFCLNFHFDNFLGKYYDCVIRVWDFFLAPFAFFFFGRCFPHQQSVNVNRRFVFFSCNWICTEVLPCTKKKSFKKSAFKWDEKSFETLQ